MNNEKDFLGTEPIGKLLRSLAVLYKMCIMKMINSSKKEQFYVETNDRAEKSTEGRRTHASGNRIFASHAFYY